jgi:hypothetical protein
MKIRSIWILVLILNYDIFSPRLYHAKTQVALSKLLTAILSSDLGCLPTTLFYAVLLQQGVLQPLHPPRLLFGTPKSFPRFRDCVCTLSLILWLLQLSSYALLELWLVERVPLSILSSREMACAVACTISYSSARIKGLSLRRLGDSFNEKNEASSPLSK